MKLKSFTAATMSDAMDQVRRALGDDAIIVSTGHNRVSGQVEITAALDVDSEDDYATPEAQAMRDRANGRGFVPAEDFGAADGGDGYMQEFGEMLAAALGWHGAPQRLTERLAQAALRVGLDDMPGALAEALDEAFRFPGLSADNRPLMLLGPSGAGKTIAAAKIAARAAIEHRPVHVLSTDTTRAAAGEQLSVLCRVMGVPFAEVGSPEELVAMMSNIPEAKIVIDTAGINPYQAKEREALLALMQASGAEPLLVLPAGMDAGETAEIAQIFTKMGVRRLLATKLDAARRLGGLLSAADASGLAFADCSCSPYVGKGFERLDALALAHFLLRDPEGNVSANMLKAAE